MVGGECLGCLWCRYGEWIRQLSLVLCFLHWSFYGCESSCELRLGGCQPQPWFRNTMVDIWNPGGDQSTMTAIKLIQVDRWLTDQPWLYGNDGQKRLNLLKNCVSTHCEQWLVNGEWPIVNLATIMADKFACRWFMPYHPLMATKLFNYQPLTNESFIDFGWNMVKDHDPQAVHGEY